MTKRTFKNNYITPSNASKSDGQLAANGLPIKCHVRFYLTRAARGLQLVYLIYLELRCYAIFPKNYLTYFTSNTKIYVVGLELA